MTLPPARVLRGLLAGLSAIAAIGSGIAGETAACGAFAFLGGIYLMGAVHGDK